MEDKQQHNRKHNRKDNGKQDWKTEKVFDDSDCRIEVQSRIGDRGGKIYSFYFSRKGREEGRFGKFFRPSDFRTLHTLLDDADDFIEEDRSQIRR